MCYGYDGEAALRRSLEEKGASRAACCAGGRRCGRSATSAPRVGSRQRGEVASTTTAGNGRGREVPADKISIQLYTVRDATLPAARPKAGRR